MHLCTRTQIYRYAPPNISIGNSCLVLRTGSESNPNYIRQLKIPLKKYLLLLIRLSQASNVFSKLKMPNPTHILLFYHAAIIDFYLFVFLFPIMRSSQQSMTSYSSSNFPLYLMCSFVPSLWMGLVQSWSS